MKKIFLLLLVAGIVATAKGQFNQDYLRMADDYFRKQDYASAAAYYEKILGMNSSKTKKNGYAPYHVTITSKKTGTQASSKEQAVYNLGESYRQLNYPAKAEAPYKEATEFDKTLFPLAAYHYATTLRSLEKFEEAEKSFQLFLDGYKNDDSYSEAAKREILNLQFIQEQLKKKDLSLYTIIKAESPLNNEGAAYAPVRMNGNIILFTSTRADSTAGKNFIHTNRLYQAVYENGITSAVTAFPLMQKKDMQQGVAALSPDENTLYITRWGIANGKKISAIYSSSKTGDQWSEPQLLDEIVNATGYSSRQPFVMPDGKHLLFASDRPGGEGGFDIWTADLDANGVASNAVNAGTIINTLFDEEAPYYYAPARTLVFSGNGRVGMGGFDFFQSKGEPGNWSAPVNMGYPVNSVRDDIYFINRGKDKNILEDVLLSSDRSAACCLELFSLKKQKLIKHVSGMVVDCETNKPLPGATVTFFNKTNNTIALTQTIGEDGTYSFSPDEFLPLLAEAEILGYDKATLPFNAPEDETSSVLTNPVICLTKIKKPEVNTVEVIDNIYYEFDQYKLKTESYASLDKVVRMLDAYPDVQLEISSHTDSKGSDKYNEQLSQQRAQACVDYLVSKGIDKTRLIAKGYGEKAPVEINKNADGSDNPEGRQKNRRAEFKVLKN